MRPRQGEALLDNCVVSTVKFNGVGIMVWCAISYRGAGTLYLNILANFTIPSVHLLSGSMIMVHHATEPALSRSSKRRMVQSAWRTGLHNP